MRRDKNKKYITNLDEIGIQIAAREKIEMELGLRSPARRVGGKLLGFESIEDLTRRDEQREKDGFGKKIKFRRILAGPGKVISVPYVEEESLSHGESEPKRIAQFGQDQFLDGENEDEDAGDITQSPGSGEGEVGDVIGEVPLPLGGGGGGEGDDGDDEGDSDGEGAGDTEGDHLEEEAYEFGKQITEKLELPNLTKKKKRFPTDEYTFELTDRHRGSGQLLDKKETLKRIVKANLLLGRVNKDDMDSTKMIVGPQDRVYRVLSRERIWKSQAVVFFLRDYSGSMWGEPTEALISQHLMIYAWLLVQYEKRVIPRFIVHDTQAREVRPRQYFGLISGGGTNIASGYKKINEIVESEGLADDYDIFIFQGSDGDDWDSRGTEAVPEIEEILSYVSRMGVTLFRNPYWFARDQKTSFEQYVERVGFLERKDVFRMHLMPSRNVTDEMNIEALKALIAQG